MDNLSKQLEDAFIKFTLNRNSKDYKFYTMFHRGGLDEALKTRKRIEVGEFFELLYSCSYEYYCFDDRINCYRYILKDMANHLDMPSWLLIEIKGEISVYGKK